MESKSRTLRQQKSVVNKVNQVDFESFSLTGKIFFFSSLLTFINQKQQQWLGLVIII